MRPPPLSPPDTDFYGGTNPYKSQPDNLGTTIFGTWQQSPFYAQNTVAAIRQTTPGIAAPPTNSQIFGQNYLKFRMKLDFSR